MNRFFLDIYGTLPRAGPGDPESTARALAMVGSVPDGARILDLGCGPGPQTLDLLTLRPDLHIVALDFLPGMLDRLRSAAEERGLAEQIELVEADMKALPFDDAVFDGIWSEGAIYNLGFENGLRSIRRLLRPGGFVAVTEAVWLSDDRPGEAREMWKEYPEIDTVERKREVIAETGYTLIGDFVLPSSSWTDLYYDPMRERISKRAVDWEGNDEAEQVLEMARKEIGTYERCGDTYSYAFFVMRVGE